MLKGLRRIRQRRIRRSRFLRYYFRYGLVSSFRRSHLNVEKMFANPRNVAQTLFLAEIADIFLSVRDGIEDEHKNDVYPFFIRAYSFWESATRLWASGRIPETYCLLRAAVENFSYAFVLREESAEHWTIESWLNREADLQNHRQRFTWTKMATGLPDDLSEDIRWLYKRCIDRGAHPNPESVNHGNTIPKGGNTVAYQTDDLSSMVFTSVDVIAGGILFLETFSRLYPVTFKNRFATARLQKLTKLFEDYIEQFRVTTERLISKYHASKSTTSLSSSE